MGLPSADACPQQYHKLAKDSRYAGFALHEVCDVGKTAIVVFDAASARMSSIANQRMRFVFHFAARSTQPCFVVCEATGAMRAISWPSS